MFNPNCARTGQRPARNLRDVPPLPGIDNAMAHQRILEQLSFEAQLLHQWTRMIATLLLFWRPYPQLTRSMHGPELSWRHRIHVVRWDKWHR